VLRASGAGAKNTEGKDGNDDDEVGEKGDAGGVLRAFARMLMVMLVVCK
jgi:hypothetical protein